MGRSAKMGEVKRAAQQPGVTSTTLGERGWTAACPARVQAVTGKPPGWLAGAGGRRRNKRAEQRVLGDRKTTASRLGIQVRAVRDGDIEPREVEGLLAARPGWLVVEQKRRQAQIEREAKDGLRRDLAGAVVDSVPGAWLRELRCVTSGAETGALGARWSAEVSGAKREAQRLAGELSPGQVRARIGCEQQAARTAGVYRAGQLARRASGAGG
jgi:hypothetical protein